MEFAIALSASQPVSQLSQFECKSSEMARKCCHTNKKINKNAGNCMFSDKIHGKLYQQMSSENSCYVGSLEIF